MRAWGSSFDMFLMSKPNRIVSWTGVIASERERMLLSTMWREGCIPDLIRSYIMNMYHLGLRRSIRWMSSRSIWFLQRSGWWKDGSHGGFDPLWLLGAIVWEGGSDGIHVLCEVHRSSKQGKTIEEGYMPAPLGRTFRDVLPASPR